MDLLLYFWLLMILKWFNCRWFLHWSGNVYFMMRHLWDNCFMLIWTCSGCSSSGETSFLYSVKNGRNNGFRIKPMYLLNHIALLVMNSSIGKRARLDLIHTKLRIPLTVEVINLEAPLFFMFELIHNSLKITTEGTVWGKVLDKFVGLFVLYNFGVELCIADEIGIWHVPLICER